MIRLFVYFIITTQSIFTLSAQIAEIEQKNHLWFVAAKSGNAEFMMETLQSGIDINAMDSHTQNTALMQAIQTGNINTVKLLIELGADVNFIVKKPDNTKTCPIVEAFRSPEILELLIESGANVNITLSHRNSPLHLATIAKSILSVEMLVKKGAEIDALDLNGRTPLHSAMYCKEIAVCLLEHGANFNLADYDGMKPLHLAYTNLEILRELIGRGASPKEFTPDGGNALHYACRDGSFELIQFLIKECSMDVNAHSRWSTGQTGAHTPIMWSLHRDHYEEDFKVLNYLLASGADLQAQMFYHYGARVQIIYPSVLACAIGNQAPHYVIQWLREHGAK